MKHADEHISSYMLNWTVLLVLLMLTTISMLAIKIVMVAAHVFLLDA